MIKLSITERNHSREEIAQIIQGWTVDVTLKDGYKTFTGNGEFRGIYHHHDADGLSFEIFDKETGVKELGARSIGFGWEMFQEIKLVQPGKVCSVQGKTTKRRRK